MIKLYEDPKIFLDICDKLKYVKDCEIKQKTLYNYMIAGIYNKKIFTYASYDKDKMNGCLVLSLAKDLIGDLTLFMVFIWIDAHYPKLTGEYIELAEKKAKENGSKKICFITKRDPKVVKRRLRKYNYIKKYSIFEKVI